MRLDNEPSDADTCLLCEQTPCVHDAQGGCRERLYEVVNGLLIHADDVPVEIGTHHVRRLLQELDAVVHEIY